jgi:peptidyl-prolyl cis-trans isomerase SurA
MRNAQATRLIVVLLVAVFLAGFGCRSGGGAQGRGEVWAEVNGRPIYRAQVEKYYDREVSVLPEPLAPAEEHARKLSILSGLIQEEILWQQAVQAGIQSSDADVETRLQEMRSGLPQQEFEQQLAGEGATLAELKAELRRDIAIRRLFDQEVRRGVQVSDDEVDRYYEQYKNHFRTIETQYHAAHILVTPRREAEVRNLRNDDATSEATARDKVQRLRDLLRAGEDFSELARAYSEDPSTALAGGDLGFFPESALQDSHPALRSALQRLEEGQVTGPIRTREGYQLIKLLERQSPGQRDLTDPGVQQTIRDRLSKQKRQLLEMAYAEGLRNRARVKNFLARQILESHRLAP